MMQNCQGEKNMTVRAKQQIEVNHQKSFLIAQNIL